MSYKNRITFLLGSPHSGGVIDIWADAIGSHGTLLGVLNVSPMHTYGLYENQSTPLALQGLYGNHDLYLDIVSGTGIANLASFQLT